jgi:predicted thioredoxin/glutaredoxin
MRNANRRNDAWIRDALRAKDRAEKDYFDYKLAVEAFGRLLLSVAETRGRLAARADPALLVGDDLVMQAYKRALEASKQMADEMEKARQLAAPR